MWGLTGWVANRYAVLLVAIRAKNISPLHWLLVGLASRVANRVRGVYGLRFGRKILRPCIGWWWWGRLTGLRTGYAVVLVAIRAKNVSPLHWLMMLGMTGRVANRYAVVMVCDAGEKYFAPTLIGGVGAD